MKRKLENVTLIGIDCVDVDRLILATDICLKNFDFGDVKLLSSIDSNHPNIVKIDSLNSLETYSEFCTKKLDNYIDTEFALIIQHDGFILNPYAWDDEFLNYDYVGAPWHIKDWAIEKFGVPEELRDTILVGNGGFNLRSKKLIRAIKEMDLENSFDRYQPEDVVICVDKRNELEKKGIKFAPPEVAGKFSFEAIDEVNNKWTDQFGFHGLSWTDISKWLNENPKFKNKINNTLE